MNQIKNRKIAWKPTPRQTKALLSEADETLYGGARGGGKTDAGMVWLIEPKYISHPKYRGLVIRRNADDLSDWIDRAERMYLSVGGKKTGNPVIFTFPSGAKIKTGHLKDAGAYTKYQGHEYQKMLLEELTHIARESDYEKLRGSNRSTIPGLKAKMFATTNPDGDGHEWVKERFDCDNADEKIREFLDEKTGLNKTRIFIPAKVEDNPYLTEADPGYVAYLNSIQDETLRKQWRDGSWEEPNVEGAYYTRQIKQAIEENRITKVPIEDMPVDTWWDLGIGDSMAIWFTQSYGKEVRVIDYYENEGEGLPFYFNILKEKGYNYGDYFAPHDIAVRELTTGASRKETAKIKYGVDFRTVPKLSIEDGINAVREIFARCWFDKDRCKQGLRVLKYYRKEFDDKHNCYKNKPEHNWASHGSDAFRTMAVGYGKFKNKEKPKQFIPNYNKIKY